MVFCNIAVSICPISNSLNCSELYGNPIHSMNASVNRVGVKNKTWEKDGD